MIKEFSADVLARGRRYLDRPEQYQGEEEARELLRQIEEAIGMIEHAVQDTAPRR